MFIVCSFKKGLELCVPGISVYEIVWIKMTCRVKTVHLKLVDCFSCVCIIVCLHNFFVCIFVF